MYSFKDRFMKLVTLDKIRICKIFEIFQYTFIFLLLLVILEHYLNKYYFKNLKLEDEFDDTNDHHYKIFKLFLVIFRDTFLIILCLFYLRKIGLLFPSIPNLIYPEFQEHTTLELSIHIALVVVFIEFLPEYKKKLDKLRQLISKKK